MAFSCIYNFLNGSCGRCDQNILNCFSAKGASFKKEIARYAEVIVIL